jgi:hypothetical protein
MMGDAMETARARRLIGIAITAAIAASAGYISQPARSAGQAAYSPSATAACVRHLAGYDPHFSLDLARLTLHPRDETTNKPLLIGVYGPARGSKREPWVSAVRVRFLPPKAYRTNFLLYPGSLYFFADRAREQAYYTHDWDYWKKFGVRHPEWQVQRKQNVVLEWAALTNPQDQLLPRFISMTIACLHT